MTRLQNLRGFLNRVTVTPLYGVVPSRLSIREEKKGLYLWIESGTKEEALGCSAAAIPDSVCDLKTLIEFVRDALALAAINQAENRIWLDETAYFRDEGPGKSVAVDFWDLREEARRLEVN